MLKEAEDRWTTVDAAELYEVPRWGKGYFSVGDAGQLLVHPRKNENERIDLPELIQRLQSCGIDLPVLLRFNGIIDDRLREIHEAFSRAIAEYDYQGRYSCIFPIKVNQQRHVVEEVLRGGSPFGFGVEAGSKPELLALMSMTEPQTPIICNGFKDAEFIEAAMWAQKIGRRAIPVVEKYTELELIRQYAERVGVRPELGMRVKLASRGSGRWQASGGYLSKFGLTTNEVLCGLDELHQHGMADCFTLLHFHLGSQVTNIRRVKGALTEAARVYVELVGRGAGLKMLDVGGGLGVDYDGSQTDFHSSVNYTLQEYANDVVYNIQSVCDDANVPHPMILSESGRAVAAYHSVLVFNVLGVSGNGYVQTPEKLPADAPQQLEELQQALSELTARNLLESYHDAQQSIDTVMSLFCTGHVSLEQRNLAELFYWAICRRIRQMVGQLDYVPEELEGLDRSLADTYFCNFSLFQSIPDSWAINQLFPVMPIHRLNERPTRHAVLGDITCDSDGKIDQFIDRRDVRRTLRLHELDDSRYCLGVFLIGAYQEILGDLHNLFGDTNAVHVDVNEQGEVLLESVIEGDTVAEVLEYVQFDSNDLMRRMRSVVDAAVRETRLNDKEADQLLKFYESGLHGYTYLEEVRED